MPSVVWSLTPREHGDKSTPPHIPEALPETAAEGEDVDGGDEESDPEGHVQQLDSLDVRMGSIDTEGQVQM